MRPIQIALLLLPVLVAGAAGLAYTGLSTDEYAYLNAAHDLYHGNVSAIANPGRFPLFPVVLSAAYGVFGESQLVARLLNLFFGCLTVLVVYLFTRELAGEDAAWVAGLLAASAPLVLFLDTRLLTEPLFILLSTVSLYTIYRAGRDPKWLVATGAVTGLLFLDRYTGIYLLIVAAAYVLWRRGLSAQVLGWGVACGAAFLAILSPWLLYSQQLTGSPIGLLVGFLAGQVGSQGSLALPDKIPVYLPFIFVLLGFASFGWLYGFGWLKEKWQSEKQSLLLCGLVIPWLVLEASGLFHPDLLRYIAPLSPVLAMVFGMSMVREFSNPQATGGKSGEGNRLLAGTKIFIRKNWRALVYAAVALNVLLAIGVIVWFGGYHKHVAYHQVGQFAAANCATVYSNIQDVVYYYSLEQNTATPSQAQCVIYSPYEGANTFVPPSYQEVYSFYGVTVYQKP